MKRTMAAILPVLVVVLSGPVAAQWAQWRGPGSQGVSPEQNLPFEWSDTKNVVWKTSVPGQGFSQPIIWKDRIFLTTDVETGAAPVEHKAVIHRSCTLPATSSSSPTIRRRGMSGGEQQD